MKATQHEYGKVQSAMFKLFQGLGESGGEVITRLNDDPEYVDRVARLILQGDATANTRPNHKLARAIMGENMLGIEEVQRYYGVTLTAEEMEKAAVIPYSERILQKCRNTHLLVLGYPLCAEKITKLSRFEIRYSPKEYPDGTPAFQVEIVPFGWYLISRSVVTTSCSPDQLKSGRRLPTRAEALYAYVLKNRVVPKSYPLRDVAALCQASANGGELYMSYYTLYGLLTCKEKPVFRKHHPSDKDMREGVLELILPDS